MKAWMQRALTSVLLLGSLLLSRQALAQTFPSDSAWVPITLNGVSVTDPLGDAQNERDIVGDATFPAAYVYRDATHIYFRLRVDATPLSRPTEYKPFGWGVAFDTNGNLDQFEYLAMLNGIANPDQVELYQNTSPGTRGNARDSAETLLQMYDPATHARVLEAPSMFGSTPDFFVDWTVAVQDLVAAGVDLTQPLRFIFGTSNNAQTLASDLLAASSSTTIADIASDPVNCSGTTCTACSALCGTSCTRCAAPTPACDGTQCVECQVASDCKNAALPLCDVATGTCVARPGCTTDAQCTLASAPACQPNGQCGECSATNKSRCTAALPVCNVATGTCVADPNAGTCTTDADCKNSAAPACQANGQCGECSATNKARCTAALPVCNVATGTCVADPNAGTCTTDADCKNSAAPACQANGQCGECSATNKARCTAALPVCALATGTCIADPNTGPGTCTTDADCKDPAKPACQPDRTCGECSKTNETICDATATAAAPRTACNVPIGTCAEPCTSDTSCTDPTRPACQPSGVCGQCSATNDTLCAAPTPVCSTGQGICVEAGCTTDKDCTNPALPACRADRTCGECSSTNTTLCQGALSVCSAEIGVCIAKPTSEAKATFEGSGIGCAMGHNANTGGSAELLLALIAGAAVLNRRRRRVTRDRSESYPQ
ncbi:MAG: hypothetical protein ACOY0T_31450 [Myxococcota bacterium]